MTTPSQGEGEKMRIILKNIMNDMVVYRPFMCDSYKKHP